MPAILMAMPRAPQADRVEALLNALGRSPNWLANELRISKQKVYNWLAGQQPRETGTWERMIAFLEAEYAKAAGKPAPIAVAETRVVTLGPPLIPVGFPLAKIRYAGQVPCSSEWGDPLESTDFVEVDVRFEHPKRFAASVVGDSCYPALKQGDLTVWHSDLNPPYNLIVLAQRRGDHGCTVKQLVWDAEEARPVLRAVNPGQSPPPDGDGWDVVARLVAVVRKVDGVEQTWYMPDGLRVRHLTGE